MRSETNTVLPSPQEIVKDAIIRIRNRNPAFSNNALARAAGVTSGFISQFLNGKKDLSLKTAVSLARALKLSEAEEELLIRSLSHSKNSNGEKKALELARDFHILEKDQQFYLSHWYHAAIADLTRCKGYKHDPVWLSKRLKISKLEAEEALKRLERMEILIKKNGKWVLKNTFVQIPTKTSQSFIREFHKQMMEKAILHMQNETSQNAFDARSIRGRTMAINPKKIEKAKKIIQNFLDKMTEVLIEGDLEEIYQLNVQLFPLTGRGEEK